MGIKQQKDIKAFLVERLEDSVACDLFDRQSELLGQLVAGVTGKSANRTKTLKQTILPRIALYKALMESRLPDELALALMRAYMMDVVAAQKHASTAKMQVVPGFSLSTSACSCASCAQAIYGKARRITAGASSMRASRNACGTMPAWTPAAPNCVRCSAMWTT